MTTPHGRFVWYEMLSTDAAKSKAFYADVLGWGAQDIEMPGDASQTYTLFTVDGNPVAGLVHMTEQDCKETEGRSAWLGHVAVDDVDARADQARKAGADIKHGPADVPGYGRYAVFADPQGAVIGTFKPDGPPPEGQEHGPVVGWHELYAEDGATALGFYADLFGWQKDQAMDMGPMGTYQTFMPADAANDTAAENNPASRSIGGMMTRPENFPAPFWNYYFVVDDVEATAEKVKRAGGSVFNGPMEVPGGAHVINCHDTQGAIVSMVSPPKS